MAIVNSHCFRYLPEHGIFPILPRILNSCSTFSWRTRQCLHITDIPALLLYSSKCCFRRFPVIDILAVYTRDDIIDPILIARPLLFRMVNKTSFSTAYPLFKWIRTLQWTFYGPTCFLHVRILIHLRSYSAHKNHDVVATNSVMTDWK